MCSLNNPRKYLISQKSKQTKNEGGKYFFVKRPTLQSQTSLDLFQICFDLIYRKKDISAKCLPIQFDHEN